MVKVGIVFFKYLLVNLRFNYYIKMKKKLLILKLDFFYFVVIKVDRVVF